MSLVTYELDGTVALIGLNRPDKRNAINEELVQCLGEAVDRAQEEADAAVLFGHGEHFCAGLDLQEAMNRATGKGPIQKKRKRHSWHVVFDKIARGAVPFVGAIHGAAIGGGIELATATHIRVADTTAFFGLPEAQRGIFVGGGGTVRVQRVVGYSVMSDMMLTGRILNAEEAAQVQLVRYQTPAGGALEKARELAARIAQNPRDANWKILNVLPRVNDLAHDDGLFMEYLCANMARDSDTTDRLRDFLEKKTR